MEAESGRTVVDGTTEDKDERSVHLDTIEISSTKAYIIKYEFFEKYVGQASYEDRTISGAHLGASGCSKPFVVQEMVLISKELVKKRSDRYAELKNSESSSASNGLKEHQISELAHLCDFSTLKNARADLKHGENGLYCTRAAFSYPVEGPTHNELNKVFQERFTVAGAENEPATYLFDMTLGFDFATAA